MLRHQAPPFLYGIDKIAVFAMHGIRKRISWDPCNDDTKPLMMIVQRSDVLLKNCGFDVHLDDYAARERQGSI